MSNGRSNRLPEGLPVCLISPNNGFDTLCNLLIIDSRQRKQEIANHPDVKRFLKDRRSRTNRNPKTAIRLQQDITDFYRNPAERRSLWENLYEITSGFQKALPDGILPSLEYLALRKYDKEFINADIDESALLDCGAVFELDSTYPNWVKPALTVLPSVRADFTNWRSLRPERQTDVLLAVFSIATLLDDVRLLRWVAEKGAGIAEEFSFTEPQRGEAGKNSYSDISQTNFPAKDFIGALQQACQNLSNAALDLRSETPSIVLFDSIANYANDVARLREPALKVITANNTDSLITRFCDFLRNQSKHVPWLAAEADNIESRWRDAYPTTDSGKTAKLQSDIERGERDTKTNLEDWAMATAEVAEANDLLRACQDKLAMASGVAARIKASEQEEQYLQSARESNTREREAMLRVLAAASPFGSKYAVHQFPIQQTEHDAETGNIDTPSEPNAMLDDAGEETTETQKDGTSTTQAVEAVKDVQTDTASEIASLDSKGEILKKQVPQKVPAVHKAADTTGAGLADDESQASDPNETAIWHAVGDGRIGLAYQIARLRAKVESSTVLHPTSELLAAVALGGYVSGPEGELTHEFSRYAKAVLANPNFEGVESEIRDALNLLLVSASLRPALFAPQTGAISMLRSVEPSGKFTSVYQLAETVAVCAQRLQGINFDILRLDTILDAAVWKDHLEKHTEQVREWQASAGSKRFLFNPAEKVWKHWLHQGGILFELAGLITDNVEASVPRVREIIDKLTDKKSFAQLVDDTYRKKLRLKGNNISGRALDQLSNDADKLIRLGRNWMWLVESKPSGERFVENTVADFRGNIEKFVPRTLADIAAVQERSPSAGLSAALVRVRKSVESLARLFGHDREFSETQTSCDPGKLLTRDLLYIGGLDIGPDGDIDAGTSVVDTLALLINTGSHLKTLADAFEMRLSRGDIAGAWTVCEQMTHEDDLQEDVCREQLAKVLSEKRRELERDLDDSSEKLEQSFRMGEASEDEFNVLNASIVSVRGLLSHRDSVVEAARIVSGFKDNINTYFNQVIKQMRAQFEPYFPLKSDREQASVERALETGDLITLYEQLDRLKNGDSLLSKESDNRGHLEKFLAAVDEIDESFNKKIAPVPDTLIRSVSKGENILGLNFSSLSQPQLRRSTNLLELWYALARSRTVDAGEIRGFLECLGFTVRDCRPDDESSVTIRVEPLRSRDFCPVHTFGSHANGHYKIVLNWRSPPQESIVQSLGENRNRCVIVFHFGRLMDDEREWLRQWSIRNRAPFITADESLVLFLSSLPGSTLRAFFDCTLPFAAVQPFFTAAGLVPPESFYGREIERQEIMNRWGSCFVFGGRQLGKTALLRSAEASFHEPEARQVAKWVDLKVHDIGIAHGAENIWKTLWDILRELGVIEPGKRLPQGRDGQATALTDAVSSWVSQGENSCVLLLLDEADAFLADDLKNDFRESTRLKGLMDETDRKFKVVFSGLHNVLRTTERANHPLAHFGEPICVGPLLSNGELDQARALLREPLAAAGCEFETDNLATHILGWTNYYPLLIQSYGAELVQYLHDSAGRSFPYMVTMSDIKAVFARDGLRDYIRQRFSLTLQLDSRYEVIAYAMALQLQGDSTGLSQGLLPPEVLGLAKEWWLTGFEISEKEFETLLQEMCGLGVLRIHRNEGERSRYTFRNPNVLSLLGDSNEIEQILYKEREAPEIFEASDFHAQYPEEKKRESSRRGPLTYEQESLLVRRGGVTVISGTEAANIEYLGMFLSQRMGSEMCRELKLCTDDAGLVSQLTGLRPGARGIHVYLVPREAPWTLRWIERAASALRRVQRRDRIRVVFSAEPQQLWNFVSDFPEQCFGESDDLFEWFGIHPWNHAFLRRWCSDLNLQVGTPQVSKLLVLSGGWPCVLEHYAESHEKKWQAKIQEIESYIAEHQTELLEKLGLGSPQARNEVFTLLDYRAFTPDEARETAQMVIETQRNERSGPTEDALVRRLWWTKQLGLFQDVEGTWGPNSLLKQILPKARL